MEEYERHSLSFAYDALTMESGLGILVNSMREAGYDTNFPIILYEGAILDGWNRYHASKIAGVDPTFIEFKGSQDDAISFVIRNNSARRHMTKIQQAYAIRSVEVLLPPHKQHTSAELAALTGASKAQVDKAFRMTIEHPEVAESVAEGATPAEKAEQDMGYSDPPAPKAGLLCTNSNVTKRFIAALTGVPGLRERATQKGAMNEALKLWAQAREQGFKLVSVPPETPNEEIEAIVSKWKIEAA